MSLAIKVFAFTIKIMSNLKRVLYDKTYQMTPEGAKVSYAIRLLLNGEPKSIFKVGYQANIMVLHMVYEAVATVASSKNKMRMLQAKLTKEEMANGCRLGFDSYADTLCAGRHSRVELFVEGKMVTTNGFAASMESMKGLPIANVLYAYDSPDGEVFVL